jgi:hypothetical protein
MGIGFFWIGSFKVRLGKTGSGEGHVPLAPLDDAPGPPALRRQVLGGQDPADVMIGKGADTTEAGFMRARSCNRQDYERFHCCSPKPDFDAPDLSKGPKMIRPIIEHHYLEERS